MSLSLHELKPSPGSHHRVKRLGRGNASGHGTTATRGTKGQRARQGGRKGLGQFGVKHFIAHLPKVRGFQSSKIKPEIVRISDLKSLSPETVVDTKLLHRQGLVASKSSVVKLIGAGTAPAKLTVQVQFVSVGARAAIEKFGGKVEIIT